MTENNETSRFVRLYDAYGKHLAIISFLLTLMCTISLFLESNFEISYVQVPLGGQFSVIVGVVCVVLVFHGGLTFRLAERGMYAHKLIYIERIETYGLWCSLGVVFSIILSDRIGSYIFPDVIITGILSTLLWWILVFFLSLLVVMVFILLFYRLVSSYVRSKLCFITTLDNLRSLHELEHLERRKYVNKYFKWFKVGLHEYNDYITERFPDHPQIKEMDSYYDSAYLLALTGNAKEVKDLEKSINEIHASTKEKDFRRFLIALQRIKGKKTKKETSIYQLSNLFRTVPLSSRIKTSSMTIAKVLVVLITLVAGIIEIMKFLGM